MNGSVVRGGPPLSSRSLFLFFSLSLSFSSSSWLLAACAKQDEVIIETASGKELTATDIDRDPLALLPGGAIGVAYLDAQQLFASNLGPKLLSIAQRAAPLPPSAGYEPRRDLLQLYVGIYSMQGVDVAGVATGTFNRERLERLAAGTETTNLGAPLAKTTYAGRTLYTTQDVGFTVLTAHTALFGNQTGMRRALDRIKEGRVERQVPVWLQRMVQQQNSAPMIVGIDLRAHPVPDATRQQLAFVDGLETAGIIGNFQPPGLNLAGTLSYSDAAAAERGAQNLTALRQQLQSYSLLLAIFGVAQPLRRLEAKANDKETQFVAEIEGRAVTQLLDMADKMLPQVAGAGQ